LKYLFVSNIFFNVARRYPIFCSSVGYRSEKVMLGCTDLSWFKLPVTDEDPKGFSKIILSYEKTRSLLSMLKPNHFLMVFDNSKVSNKTVVEAIGHLDFVHGKIALGSTGNFQNELSLLLNQFSCRKLEFLQCSSEFLTRSEIALKVGHYDAELPVNNVQFHKILRHNFDSLSFEIDDNFIANSEEPAFLPILSMNRYNSLKWLSVNCGECYDSLMAFLDVIKENCPKLEALTIFL